MRGYAKPPPPWAVPEAPVPACRSRPGFRGRRFQPGRRENFPGEQALLLAAAALQIFPLSGCCALLWPLARSR